MWEGGEGGEGGREGGREEGRKGPSLTLLLSLCAKVSDEDHYSSR